MKAVLLREPGAAEIVNLPEPDMGPEDVLVDVCCVGLCGSDLRSYRGLMPMVTYPRVPGHEVGGVVAAKGGRVPDEMRVGAKVMLSPYSNCGRCTACLVERPNCCEHNQTLGVQRDGALTERLALHYTQVFASETLAVEELALVEPLSVGYHATNRGRVTEQDIVAVLGCGTIGMGAVAAAARQGATVIAVDIDDAKLAMAGKLGAHHTVNPAASELKQRVAELTQGDGVHVVIEAAGLPATYQAALDLVCFAGRVVCIGYAGEAVPLDTKQIVSKELDLLGSRNALGVFPDVMRMLEARDKPFTELITTVYPFEETPQAFSDWDADPGSFSKILIRLRREP